MQSDRGQSQDLGLADHGADGRIFVVSAGTVAAPTVVMGADDAAKLRDLFSRGKGALDAAKAASKHPGA